MIQNKSFIHGEHTFRYLQQSAKLSLLYLFVAVYLKVGVTLQLP